MFGLKELLGVAQGLLDFITSQDNPNKGYCDRVAKYCAAISQSIGKMADCGDQSVALGPMERPPQTIVAAISESCAEFETHQKNFKTAIQKEKQNDVVDQLAYRLHRIEQRPHYLKNLLHYIFLRREEGILAPAIKREALDTIKMLRQAADTFTSVAHTVQAQIK